MTPSARDRRIEFRASTEELEAWQAAADLEELSLSDWIRRSCNRGLGKPVELNAAEVAFVRGLMASQPNPKKGK